MTERVNPIRSVDGAAVPCPAAFTWRLDDVSGSGAGRTEDGLMHTKRMRQTAGIDLSWNAVDTATVSAILRAFAPEYVSVTYLDPVAGDFVTADFYVSGRTSPMYNATRGLWNNVSFSIVQR